MTQSKYLGALTSEARTDLQERLLSRQSGRCFICNEPIDLVLHNGQIDIDHIDPLGQQVKKAIRGLRGATRKAIKAVNQRAAQRLSRGDYRTAESLVAKAREIQQFETDIDALRTRWREISSGASGGKKPVTPLWQYYQPVLRALVAAGGSSSLAQIEASVGQAMAGVLLAGDLASGPRGKERWRVMLQRCRRPMVAEGWLEKRPGKNWRITEAGRKAAERPVKPDR